MSGPSPVRDWATDFDHRAPGVLQHSHQWVIRS